MLKVRLQRVGKRNDPSFRVVVTDSRNAAKSGKFLEVVGNYDPKKDTRAIDGERVKYWVSQGAQVSDTVHNLLVSEKIIDGKKVNVLPKKTPIKSEAEEVAEAAPATEAPAAPAEESAPAAEEAAPVAEEAPAEAPAEEVKEEAPAAEEAPEEPKEAA